MLCTLLINAPLLPRVLRLTKLDVVPDARLALRRRALRALDAHTASAVTGLRAEEDAMMAGVDWARVRELTKVGGAGDFASFAEQAGGGGGKEGEERARRRKHLKSVGGSQMRHGMTDVWEGLASFFWRSAVAVARVFGGGRGRGDVSVGAADTVAPSHHLDPRRQKSTSSMATIFLDEAGADAKHHRVFGRTISLVQPHPGSADAPAAASSAAESPLAFSSSPVASMATAVASRVNFSGDVESGLGGGDGNSGAPKTGPLSSILRHARRRSSDIGGGGGGISGAAANRRSDRGGDARRSTSAAGDGGGEWSVVTVRGADDGDDDTSDGENPDWEEVNDLTITGGGVPFLPRARLQSSTAKLQQLQANAAAAAAAEAAAASASTSAAAPGDEETADGGSGSGLAAVGETSVAPTLPSSTFPAPAPPPAAAASGNSDASSSSALPLAPAPPPPTSHSMIVMTDGGPLPAPHVFGFVAPSASPSLAPSREAAVASVAAAAEAAAAARASLARPSLGRTSLTRDSLSYLRGPEQQQQEAAEAAGAPYFSSSSLPRPVSAMPAVGGNNSFGNADARCGSGGVRRTGSGSDVLATAAAANGEQQQQLSSLWRAQEAAMGAALTSPTSSLRSARPPPKHRTVFEAFGIEQPSSSSNAGAGAPLPPPPSSSSAQEDVPGELSRFVPRRASAAGSSGTWSAGLTGGISPLVAMRRQEEAAAAAAEGGAGGSLRAGRSFAARESASSVGAAAGAGGAAAAAAGALARPSLASAASSSLSRIGTNASSTGTLQAQAGRALKHALSAARAAASTAASAAAPPAARRRRLPTGTPLEELRVRLATSLKRHFHAKRADGLLSTRAARALDTACDAAIDEPSRPLDLWAAVERDVTARWASRLLAHLALWTRLVNIAVVGKGGGGKSANRAAAARRRRAQQQAAAAQAAVDGQAPGGGGSGGGTSRTRPAAAPPAPSPSFSCSSVLTAFRRGLAWPLAKLSRLLLWSLSRLMLVACESAMEMMLALTFAPAAAFAAARSGAAGDESRGDVVAAAADAVADEVDNQLRQVWLFLHDREAEAPERFQAIQTYRATMAVLRKQAAFVDALFEAGAVDDDERAALRAPLEERESALERRGPTWRAPSPADVLRALPFVRASDPEVAAFFLRRSSLREHPSGAVVASGAGEPAGFIVVVAGLVRVTAHSRGPRAPSGGGAAAAQGPSGGGGSGSVVVVDGGGDSLSSLSPPPPPPPPPPPLPSRIDGNSALSISTEGRARQDVYLGCGGLTGLFSSLTGTEWGVWAAVAEGNALGKGPLVLHIPQSAVDELRARSAAGSAACQQAEVDMFRMASLFVVERERPRLMGYLQEALKHRAEAEAEEELGAGRLFGGVASLARARSVADALRRRAQRERDGDGDDDGDGDAGGGGGAAEKENAASLPAARTAADEFRAFVRGLAASELVELPPGAAFNLRSSAVLMRGSVCVKGRAVAAAAKGEEEGKAAVPPPPPTTTTRRGPPPTAAPPPVSPSSEGRSFEYIAPALLPWFGPLARAHRHVGAPGMPYSGRFGSPSGPGGGGGGPSSSSSSSFAVSPFTRLVAGASGAALMVTPTAGAAPVTHASCLDLESLARTHTPPAAGGRAGGGSVAPAKGGLVSSAGFGISGGGGFGAAGGGRGAAGGATGGAPTAPTGVAFGARQAASSPQAVVPSVAAAGVSSKTLGGGGGGSFSGGVGSAVTRLPPRRAATMAATGAAAAATEAVVGVVDAAAAAAPPVVEQQQQQAAPFEPLPQTRHRVMRAAPLDLPAAMAAGGGDLAHEPPSAAAAAAAAAELAEEEDEGGREEGKKNAGSSVVIVGGGGSSSTTTTATTSSSLRRVASRAKLAMTTSGNKKGEGASSRRPTPSSSPPPPSSSPRLPPPPPPAAV